MIMMGQAALACPVFLWLGMVGVRVYGGLIL
jgi:hypothetical protein